jgi:hypothetical protein
VLAAVAREDDPRARMSVLRATTPWVVEAEACRCSQANRIHREYEMEPILMIVSAPLIGWFVRQRLAGFVAYLAIYSFLFTFQSVQLITKWAGGSKNAFGGFPKASKGDVWSYGVVNLLFLLVGVGLLVFAQYLAARRQARSTVAAPAVPVRA